MGRGGEESTSTVGVLAQLSSLVSTQTLGVLIPCTFPRLGDSVGWGPPETLYMLGIGGEDETDILASSGMTGEPCRDTKTYSYKSLAISGTILPRYIIFKDVLDQSSRSESLNPHDNIHALAYLLLVTP